jgi:hypothetical protein
VVVLIFNFDNQSLYNNKHIFLIIWLLFHKAELLQEGIFFLIHLFARDVLVGKKLEIEKTKPTFIISVLKVEY